MKIQKERMLEAVLTHPNVKSACESAGVPVTTFYSWMRSDDDFKKALNERISIITKISIERLRNLNEAAVGVLENSLRSDQPELAFRAASKIADIVLRFYELEKTKKLDIAIDEVPRQSIRFGDKTIYF